MCALGFAVKDSKAKESPLHTPPYCVSQYLGGGYPHGAGCGVEALQYPPGLNVVTLKVPPLDYHWLHGFKELVLLHELALYLIVHLDVCTVSWHPEVQPFES